MGAGTQLESMIRSLPLSVLTLGADNFPHPTPHQSFHGREPGHLDHARASAI